MCKCTDVCSHVSLCVCVQAVFYMQMSPFACESEGPGLVSTYSRLRKKPRRLITEAKQRRLTGGRAGRARAASCRQVFTQKSVPSSHLVTSLLLKGQRLNLKGSGGQNLVLIELSTFFHALM